MKEIISAQTVERLFLILAVLLPLLGLAWGAWRKKPLHGLLWGLLGVGNWLLWKLYNLITDRLGLDTMLNLYVNLVVFAVIGLTVGAIIGRREAKQNQTPRPQA